MPIYLAACSSVSSSACTPIAMSSVRMDPAIADWDAAFVDDALAQGDRPPVLQQNDRSGSVLGNVVEHVPGLSDLENVAAGLGHGGSAFPCARLRTLFTGGTEPDERTDGRSELFSLIHGEVAELTRRDLARPYVHPLPSVTLTSRPGLVGDASKRLAMFTIDSS